jgi:antitoxin (DNA-binding transcriptional repressor) of toxin-antitoxin stability system
VRSVGIRELKNRLSEFIRIVQAGEQVLVTNRGRVVAELREPNSLEDGSVPTGVTELARRGHLKLASSGKARYPKLPRVKTGPGSQELLDTERVDRANR